jgi:hypothetical protein
MITILLLAACSPTDSLDAVAAPGCVDCLLADENQLQVEPTLIPRTIALEAGADVHFDWSSLSQDVYGRTMSGDEGDSEAWLISSRTSSVADLIDGMAHEALDQSALTLFVTCLSDDPSCLLSEFRLLDGAADVHQRFASSEESWGLVVVNPRDGGLGAVAELVPSRTDAAQEMEVREPSTLTYVTDLAEADTLKVRAGEPALRMDWSAVTSEALGGRMVPGSADTLFLMQTSASAADLEAHIYDLGAIADRSWSMSLGNTTVADLALLEGETAFTGIDNEGTWVLALQCGGCATPAPRLLTVLEAAE